jgi:hypothetical protein
MFCIRICADGFNFGCVQGVVAGLYAAIGMHFFTTFVDLRSIDSIDVKTQYRSHLIWRLLDDKCANFDFVTLS